jgi:8-oxo-dGTP pyrophosphatase MutT (NUDIX family)
VIRAAGGIILRNGSVLLVHRPRYDDWTLPKGKLEPGEGLLEAAVREVREETGLGCLAGPRLVTVGYVDASGRDKSAHYWAMAAAGDDLAPTKEIDEARWTSFEDAETQLSYDRDRRVLVRAGSLLPGPGLPVTVCLVRSAPGLALELAQSLAARTPAVLVSSPAARSVRTLARLGERCGLPVQEHEALLEGAGTAESLALLRAAGTLGTAVASTHGDVQANAVESLDAAGVPLSRPLRFEKGSIWELTLENGRFASGTYVPPPA